ncbi:tol-pal system-associated acyl-CoA thioesterase [Caulobacter segnis]|uniref:tol-pal system-associated acyl-CoA thioesterase n=1 Tax=Caulobacter segnis TaxID=88688 RepID=UPI00240FBCEB|nr:tol-pal system-associated acyl-CoA thioesterase [Caulobacter segnis]MDG2520919.1 tol-pal system-associated acyl-CoA thioesterase [Caulobacter segnis]
MTEPTCGVLIGREHHLPVRIYYEDTDFTGVVYHANYLRYFERGRSDFLRLAGISHTDLAGRDDPAAFVVVRMEIDFKRAAKVDDALTVVTLYDAVKGPRLLVTQRIMRGDELIAQAAVEAACITMDGRPRRPPADMVERLSPLFAKRD